MEYGSDQLSLFKEEKPRTPRFKSKAVIEKEPEVIVQTASSTKQFLELLQQRIELPDMLREQFEQPIDEELLAQASKEIVVHADDDKYMLMNPGVPKMLLRSVAAHMQKDFPNDVLTDADMLSLRFNLYTHFPEAQYLDLKKFSKYHLPNVAFGQSQNFLMESYLTKRNVLPLEEPFAFLGKDNVLYESVYLEWQNKQRIKN